MTVLKKFQKHGRYTYSVSDRLSFRTNSNPRLLCLADRLHMYFGRTSANRCICPHHRSIRFSYLFRFHMPLHALYCIFGKGCDLFQSLTGIFQHTQTSRCLFLSSSCSLYAPTRQWMWHMIPVFVYFCICIEFLSQPLTREWRNEPPPSSRTKYCPRRCNQHNRNHRASSDMSLFRLQYSSDRSRPRHSRDRAPLSPPFSEARRRACRLKHADNRAFSRLFRCRLVQALPSTRRCNRGRAPGRFLHRRSCRRPEQGTKPWDL